MLKPGFNKALKPEKASDSKDLRVHHKEGDMSKSKNLYLFVLVLVASVIVGCAAAEVASATAAATRVPTSRPAPTRTLRPSETPTPVPVCEGRRIAYIEEGTAGESLWVVCEDGTGKRQLVVALKTEQDSGYEYFSSLRWLPDTDRILFWHHSLEGITVETINVDGTDRSEDLFIPTSSMFEAGFTLLPDGLVLRQDWEGDGLGISLANLDGTRVRLLVDDGIGLSLSPDGTRLAFVRYQGGSGALYTVNMDGTGERKLAEGFELYRAFWSPDGQWLAFGAVDLADDRDIYEDGRDVYVVASDGSQFRRLTYGLFIYPYDLAWHPDSRTIAFWTESFISYAVDVSGDYDPRFLALGRNPVWAPVGRKVVFQDWNSELNSWTLYTRDLGNYYYNPFLLADHPNSNVWDPVWEP